MKYMLDDGYRCIGQCNEWVHITKNVINDVGTTEG